MDHRPRCESQNSNTSRKNTGENLDELGFGDEFSDTTPKA